MTSYKSSLRKMIAQNDFDQVFISLKKIKPQEVSMTEIIALESRFSALKKEGRMATENKNDLRININSLRMAILELIANIPEEFSPKSHYYTVNSKEGNRQYFWILLLIPALIISTYFIFYFQNLTTNHQNNLDPLNLSDSISTSSIVSRDTMKNNVIQESIPSMRNPIPSDTGKKKVNNSPTTERKIKSETHAPQSPIIVNESGSVTINFNEPVIEDRQKKEEKDTIKD